MNRTIMRTGICAILLAGGVAVVFADEPQEKGKSQKGKAGQFWAGFTKAFDADGDKKVSKEEYLAKRPMFDRVDANHDGALTQEEIKANPRAQSKGKTGEGFMKRFDEDKDGKVTVAEYDAMRAKAFDRMDKNKDGKLDEGDLKGQSKAASDELGAE